MINKDRPNFEPWYIIKELLKIDQMLGEKLNIYLLGGAVMAINNLKSGTRDIDVLVQNKEDLKILADSLEVCGYTLLQPQDLSQPYMKLSATALENLDGFRWEIFIEYVAKKLALTGTMKQRARKRYTGIKLTVYVLSNEDLFLLKGMTERDRDLEDMAILAKSGLKYDIILNECIDQSNRDQRGNNWEASLELKCKELNEKYGILVPFHKKLVKLAEKRMINGNRKRTSKK